MEARLGAAQALQDARESVQRSDQASDPVATRSSAVEARWLRDALRALLQWAEAHERGLAAVVERVERLEGEVLPRGADPEIGLP